MSRVVLEPLAASQSPASRLGLLSNPESTMSSTAEASGSAAEAVVLTPPCFMELVTAAARHFLPADGNTMLLLHRANMLMQDTVEAACMCVRARIDPPLLAKHLVGAEHCQVLASGEFSAAGGGASPVSEWADVVLDIVGEVSAFPGLCMHPLSPSPAPQVTIPQLPLPPPPLCSPALFMTALALPLRTGSIPASSLPCLSAPWPS